MDKRLCEIVDRLRAIGHSHTLEVELRFTRVEGDPCKIDFTKVLSGLREKGVITILVRSCTHKC